MMMTKRPWLVDLRHMRAGVADPISLDDRLLYVLRRFDVDAPHVAHLLDQGASPDAVDADGRTALHVAAWADKAQIIPLLVTDTNLNHLGSGPEAATPLMVAAAAGRTQAVAALLAAGADIRCCTPSGRTALGDALARGRCAAALRLWEAAQQEPDCEAILAAAVTAAGAALDRKQFHGRTPLAAAAEKGYHQLVPLLVTPSSLNPPQGAAEWCHPPLHLALMNHHVKAAEALLDAGAAVNTPNSRGRMPLAYAIQVRDTQLSVRLLRLMQQQQQPAGDGQLPSMEPVIAAVAWLTIKPQHAHCLVRLFAAVMDAWGPSPAADLLQGLLKHLRGKPHNLAEAMLLGWRQAQTEQLHRTHVTLDRLQRLVLDPQAASRRQQQKQQCPLLRRRLEKQARALRLPLALLLTKMGHGQGRASGNAVERPSGASLAASMADLSLGHSSSSSNNSSNSSSSRANVITAAAQRGSLKEVATLLAPAAPAELPALLLTAAQAAGRAGHTYVCNAALQQFASLDWQAAACTHSSAPLGPLVRAAVAASAPATASTAAAPGGPVAATPTGTQQQRQQPQGSVSGVGFCLYRALLDSWQAVPEMVGKEFMAQVVEAVEATALAATAQAVEGA